MYDELITMATNSELRECGMLLPCETYGPDEIDIKALKRRTEVYQIRDEFLKEIRQTLYGRVMEHADQYNPKRKPMILFASAVADSLWWADRFEERGIRAAHIDASIIYYAHGKKQYPVSDQARKDLADASRDGEVEIVCNRFVLREGVNWAWLYHGIAACTFGSESAFLQAGGRLLRFYPGLDAVVWQCHGGSWWRYGSLNDDREWRLGDTNASRKSARMTPYRIGEAQQDICCPKCGKIRRAGPKCLACGHMHQRSVRHVIQTDGTLKRMEGMAVKKRKPVSEEQRHWDSCFYPALKGRGNMTFRQVMGWYYKKFGAWPPDGLRNMPARGSSQWFLPVNDVLKIWKEK